MEKLNEKSIYKKETPLEKSYNTNTKHKKYNENKIHKTFKQIQLLKEEFYNIMNNKNVNNYTQSNKSYIREDTIFLWIIIKTLQY